MKIRISLEAYREMMNSSVSTISKDTAIVDHTTIVIPEEVKRAVLSAYWRERYQPFGGWSDIIPGERGPSGQELGSGKP